MKEQMKKSAYGKTGMMFPPPAIEAWKEALTEGYSYTPDNARLPPDRGVIIKYDSVGDGCVPPFTKITFGVKLDELASCKADIVSTSNYDSMSGNYPLSQTLYRMKHKIVSEAAGVSYDENETGATIVTTTGGNYEIYVRCKDKNGNANAGQFVFKYCVSDKPDRTAPTILHTSPINGYPVQTGITELDGVEVFTNKPAQCRWSHKKQQIVMTQ